MSSSSYHMFGFDRKCSPYDGRNLSLAALQSHRGCILLSLRKLTEKMTIYGNDSYGNDSFRNDTILESTEERVLRRNLFLAKIEVALLSVMFTTAVVGNTLALVAVTLRRHKLTRMHYFILHLCISDLSVAFLHILPQLLLDIMGGFVGGYPGDNFLCKLVKYLNMFSSAVSSYVLAVTAIDRYQAICFPLTNCSWTLRRAKIMIAAGWVISLVFCVPQLFIWRYKYVPRYGRYDCWADFISGWSEKVYVLWNTMTIFVIPLLVLIFTYSCICRTVWVNFRQKSSSPKSVVPRGPPVTRTSLDGQHPHPQMSNGNHHVVVGGSYHFRGKSRVEMTLPSDNAQDGSVGHSSSSIHPRAHSVSGISRAKMKTIKLTVVVILCHVTCSLPFYSAIMYAHWYPGASNSFAFTSAYTVFTLLSTLNSCVNPWIYLIFNENLAKTLKDLFCCHLNREVQQRFGAVVVSRSSLSDTKTGTGAASIRTHNNLTSRRTSLPQTQVKLTNVTSKVETSDVNMNGHHHNCGSEVHLVVSPANGSDAPLRQGLDSPENNNGRRSRPVTFNMPKAYSSGQLSSAVQIEKCKNERDSKSDSAAHHGVKMRVKSTLGLVCHPRTHHMWKHVPNNCYGNCKQTCKAEAV